MLLNDFAKQFKEMVFSTKRIKINNKRGFLKIRN